MYKEIIESMSYTITFDFADIYSLLINFINLLVPLFLFVLGVRLGSSLLRRLCS